MCNVHGLIVFSSSRGMEWYTFWPWGHVKVMWPKVNWWPWPYEAMVYIFRCVSTRGSQWCFSPPLIVHHSVKVKLHKHTLAICSLYCVGCGWNGNWTIQGWNWRRGIGIWMALLAVSETAQAHTCNNPLVRANRVRATGTCTDPQRKTMDTQW